MIIDEESDKFMALMSLMLHVIVDGQAILITIILTLPVKTRKIDKVKHNKMEKKLSTLKFKYFE